VGESLRIATKSATSIRAFVRVQLQGSTPSLEARSFCLVYACANTPPFIPLIFHHLLPSARAA
jgi:hypothetical protein